MFRGQTMSLSRHTLVIYAHPYPKRSRAGQVSYQLLEWTGDDQGGLPRDV